MPRYEWGMTQICKACGEAKSADEFYKSNKSKCKDCVKEMVRANRMANAEYYREYDRQRFQDDPRVRERHRRYQATKAGKEAVNRARKKWLSENPEKRAAHVILGNRVRDGHIVKPDTCQDCGAGGRIHGHHHDYAKPLDVEWLCALCHAKRHQ